MPVRQRKKKQEKSSESGRKMPEQPMLLLFHTVQDKIKYIPGSDNKLLVKMVTRSLVASIMFFVAGMILNAGHVVVAAFAFGLQVMVFKELLAVRYELAKEKKIPYFRTIVWMWFAVACFYSFGLGFLNEAPFGESGMALKSFEILEWTFGAAQVHEWISFSLYVGTFCLTVLSLKKGHFEYQMQQLAWTLFTIILVTLQSKSVILNIYNGLFWIVFPAVLVITNDVMAYFCGVALGRKIYKGPFLPDLSPNKTWEGFLGAGIFTMIAGYYLPMIWAENRYMVCHFEDWRMNGETCQIPDVFVPKNHALWQFSAFMDAEDVPRINASMMQFHGLCLAAFASCIAPFGGFFASAIKRAYGIKDFGVLFPGHGGFTDRLDCQFIMALCTNVHYHTFIMARAVPTAGLIAAIGTIQRREELLAIAETVQKRLAEFQRPSG